MAAALKIAKKVSTIEALIQEAGELQAAIAAKTAQYKQLRKAIEAQIAIPEGEAEKVVQSNEYVAKLYYAEKTTVLPEKLHDLAPDLFWRTCHVAVAAIKDLLPRDEFFVVTEVNVEPLPTLRITKVKD